MVKYNDSYKLYFFITKESIESKYKRRDDDGDIIVVGKFGMSKSDELKRLSQHKNNNCPYYPSIRIIYVESDKMMKDAEKYILNGLDRNYTFVKNECKDSEFFYFKLKNRLKVYSYISKLWEEYYNDTKGIQNIIQDVVEQGMSEPELLKKLMDKNDKLEKEVKKSNKKVEKLTKDIEEVKKGLSEAEDANIQLEEEKEKLEETLKQIRHDCILDITSDDEIIEPLSITQSIIYVLTQSQEPLNTKIILEKIHENNLVSPGVLTNKTARATVSSKAGELYFKNTISRNEDITPYTYYIQEEKEGEEYTGLPIFSNNISFFSKNDCEEVVTSDEEGEEMELYGEDEEGKPIYKDIEGNFYDEDGNQIEMEVEEEEIQVGDYENSEYLCRILKNKSKNELVNIFNQTKMKVLKSYVNDLLDGYHSNNMFDNIKYKTEYIKNLSEYIYKYYRNSRKTVTNYINIDECCVYSTEIIKCVLKTNKNKYIIDKKYFKINKLITYIIKILIIDYKLTQKSLLELEALKDLIFTENNKPKNNVSKIDGLKNLYIKYTKTEYAFNIFREITQKYNNFQLELTLTGGSGKNDYSCIYYDEECQRTFIFK